MSEKNEKPEVPLLNGEKIQSDAKTDRQDLMRNIEGHLLPVGLEGRSSHEEVPILKPFEKSATNLSFEKDQDGVPLLKSTTNQSAVLPEVYDLNSVVDNQNEEVPILKPISNSSLNSSLLTDQPAANQPKSKLLDINLE